MPIIEHINPSNNVVDRLAKDIQNYMSKTGNNVMVIWGEEKKMKELYK